MQAEPAETLWLDVHDQVPLAELAALSGLSVTELAELADYGAIAPVDPGAVARSFHTECIVAARVARRLRDDFELDAHGIALALALLERVRTLEAELGELRAQLPRAR